MNTEANQEQVPNKFADVIDTIIRGIGHVIMWTNLVLIAVIILQVILRYGFGRGLVILEELQWHLYALGIMFGASYALTLDSHIRVDIVHARLSEKWRYLWDLVGIIFLLLPFAIVIFHQSLDFVQESWRVNERSDAPLGLPWRWAIKSVIPISFGLLIAATVGRAVRIIAILRRK
ncbi:MAG: TRAP transporter small permease subunit [Deltaproteobacteria bacterium]|jgi:TRAP-type mannitol/chloroaromatic compound transport system permease small subunit|nr:TRAP transporter small permease subunit [Deltaproteobacteria bacterium]